MSLTDQAHDAIRKHFSADNSNALFDRKSLAIDATCGNGFDTEFLCALDFTQVLCFDVQKVAIENTRQRLTKKSREKVVLICDDHKNMVDYMNQKVDCVIFNLGYLPGADKSIASNKESTLSALKTASNLLTENGIISILCYPGHPAGVKEKEALLKWISSLGSDWNIEQRLSENPNNRTPFLILLNRN